MVKLKSNLVDNLKLSILKPKQSLKLSKNLEHVWHMTYIISLEEVNDETNSVKSTDSDESKGERAEVRRETFYKLTNSADASNTQKEIAPPRPRLVVCTTNP